MKTIAAILCWFPALAFGACVSRIEVGTDYYAAVYNCTERDPSVMEKLRDDAKEAAKAGFSKADQGTIMPDGNGGWVYSYKWIVR